MTGRDYDCAVLIIGMHRSGSSALSRALMLLGGDCPPEFRQAGADNRFGFCETPQIRAANDELLAQAGTDWRSITAVAEDFGGPEAIDAIRAVVARQYGRSQRPVIEDPRICRLAKLWEKALSTQAERVIFPMIVRDPGEVASALAGREHVSPLQGLLLWARYNLDAEHATRDQARGIVSHAKLLSDWRAEIGRLERQIGQPLLTSEDASAGVDDLMAPNRHEQELSPLAIEDYPLIRDAWDIFSEWAHDGKFSAAAGIRLDRLRGHLDRLAIVTRDMLESTPRHGEGLSDIADEQGHSVQFAGEVEEKLDELLRLSDTRRAGHAPGVLEEARPEERGLGVTAARKHEKHVSTPAQDGEKHAQAGAPTGRVDSVPGAPAETDALIVALRADLERREREHETALAKAQADMDAAGATLQAALEMAAQKDAELRLLQEENRQLERGHVEVDWARKSVEDELKEVTRKYRSTQATLARAKAGLDIARAREARSQADAAELSQALHRLRSTWHVRAVTAILALFHRLFAPAKKRKANPRQAYNLVLDSGLFDKAWYVDRYPDVSQTGADPLEHFMSHGWQESRDPGPDFSVSRYLRENPDVAETGRNPLLHYIEFGQAEGRGARKSKLAGRVAIALPDFDPPAPVYRPDTPEAMVPAASAPLSGPEMEVGFGELRALHADAGSDAAFDRFETLCSRLLDGRRTADWADGRDEAPPALEGSWFTSERSVRLRFGKACSQPVAAFQAIGGSARVIGVTSAQDGEIADLRLLSPVHPLLLAGVAEDGSPWATLLAFPSVLRGGLHHPEYLAELARADDSRSLDPFAFSSDLAESLAISRTEGGTPAVSSLAIDVTGATGTGSVFDPIFRSWLRDLFDLPISAVPGDHDAGESHLARIVGQDGAATDGATLELPADMVPSIGLLCAPQGQNPGRAYDVPLGLAHLYGVHDDSQPGLSVLIPPVPLDAPASSALTHFQNQARLRGSAGLRRHPGPAGIRRVRTTDLSDGELLFPVSAAMALTKADPDPTGLILDCGGSDEADALRTLESLAMQSCADKLHIAVLHAPSPAVRKRATTLFEGRTNACESWDDAIAECDTLLCGAVLAGTILHDWRTLAVLADFVSSGAATASCPLVASSRAGKGWTTRIVDNGLVAEKPGDAHADAIIRSSSGIWHCTYPVQAPVAGLWIAATEKLARWTRSDTHRLDRADGEHWCTAMTSTTFLGDLSVRSAAFSPPLADPSRFTSVRVYKG